MKKLTLGLAVLLAGFTANSLAYLPSGTGTSKCDVTVPSYCGGFTFGLTGLYWRATSPQQDFATSFDTVDFSSFDDTGEFVGTGNAHNGHHHQKYDWGFQANVGYIFPCSGNDVNLEYTHWNRSHNAGTNGTVLPSFGGFLIIDADTFGPTLPLEITSGGSAGDFTNPILPLSAIITAAGFVPSFSSITSSRTEFENHTWDLDFGQAINVGCNFRMRWFGGLRYTQLENKQDTTVASTLTGFADSIDIDAGSLVSTDANTFDGAATLTDVALDVSIIDFTRNHSKFNGIGPRFGFDVAYNVMCGVGVVGSLSTSLLVGEVRNSFGERITASGSFSATGLNDVGDGNSGIVIANGGDASTAFDPATFVTAIAPVDTGIVSFNQPNETRVVPNIDAKLGLDYTYQFCNCSRTKMTIEAGYLVSHYFNSIDKLTVSDLGNSSIGPRRTLDTSFDGPYVSVQVAL
jgi:hypothetical protein